MTTWFTSDHHLGHRAMAYTRRYGEWPENRDLVTAGDIAWHDNLLAQEWDRVVSPEDTVWVLGDLTIRDNLVDASLDWIDRRPGVKHLVPGNHDPCSPIHRDSHRWQKRYLQSFESVQAFARRRVTIDGVKVNLVMSHFPLSGDGGPEERYSNARLRGVDGFLLHGHTHSSDRRTSPTEIHVGLDAWNYKPVSLDEIIMMIKER